MDARRIFVPACRCRCRTLSALVGLMNAPAIWLATLTVRYGFVFCIGLSVSPPSLRSPWGLRVLEITFEIYVEGTHNVALQMEYIQTSDYCGEHVKCKQELESRKSQQVSMRSAQKCRRGCHLQTLIRRQSTSSALYMTLVALRVRLMACRFASLGQGTC